jgi:hypothetical protein
MMVKVRCAAKQRQNELLHTQSSLGMAPWVSIERVLQLGHLGVGSDLSVAAPRKATCRRDHACP